MSTVVVATVKSNTSSPPAFQNTSGTEIGTLCRAWVNFNGTSTVAIRANFNVSSITDNGTGDYTVNFTTAMGDANYCAAFSCGGTNSTFAQRTGTQTSSGIQVFTSSTGSSTVSTDVASVFVSIFR